jgi:glycosyltransferase involved in cell wall biosynthesis
MRIFMLVQHPGARGPVPKHTSHLVAALRSLGCTVVTHPWGQRRHDETLIEKVTQRFRDVLSVQRAIQGQEFDVAVVKTAHDWHTLARDIAVVSVIRRHCRPVVLQLHGSRSSALIEPGACAFKLGTAALLALVDGVMVLSTEEQRDWQAFRARPPVLTVKNPYVRAFPSASVEQQRAHTHSDRLLFVGRLIEEKGVFDLVEAFANVHRQTHCKLVIVGEGERERELRQRIHALGLEDAVTMVGYLSSSALYDRYRESALLVLPSWSEGFPTVLAEAMDAGLPIVTTRIRGAADHLVAAENVLFVEPRDVGGLASAMIELLRNPHLRNAMGSANRERIRIFEPEVVGMEYLQALQSLIADYSTVEDQTPAKNREL